MTNEKVSQKSEKLGNNIIWYALLFISLIWVGTGTFFHAASPQFINPLEPIKKSGLKYIFITFLDTGIPFLMMLIGYHSKNLNNRYFKIYSSWLYLIILEIAVIFSKLIVRNEFSLIHFYDAIFPLTRNTFPLVSAILLGLCSLKLVQQFFKSTENYKIKVVYFVLFLLPTIFNKDIWHYDDGHSVLFYWLTFNIGLYLSNQKINNERKKDYLLFGICSFFAFFLIYLMPYVTYNISLSLKNADRFTDISSFFILTSIYLLVKLLISYAHTEKKTSLIQLTTIIGFIILTQFAIKDILVKTIVDNAKGSYLLVLFYSISLTTLLITILFIVNILLTSTYEKLNSLQKIKLSNLEISSNTYQVMKVNIESFLRIHQFTILLFGLFYLLTLFSFFSMNFSIELTNGIRFYRNVIFFELFVKQGIILLTWIYLIVIFGLLRSLTNKFWLSASLTSLLVIIFSIAGRLKLIFRGEPIYPSDIDLFTIPSLMKMVSPLISIGLFFGITITLIATFFLEKKYPVNKISNKAKLLIIILALGLFSAPFSLNSKNSRFQTLFTALGNDPQFYNQELAVKMNGPIIQFINNVDVNIMNKPSNYSKAKMVEISNTYNDLAKSININRSQSISNQNVVFILSESFTDPKRIPDLTIKKDPIPFIRQLKKDTPSGIMMSSAYGGGTANMEYMSLTGMNLSLFTSTISTPYSQVVSKQKLPHSINQNFKESIAIHPFLGIYYSRQSVYKKFAFDAFHFVGSKNDIKFKKKIKNSHQLSDETAYDNTLAALKASKTDNMFINLVTMQNHMPYNNWYGNESSNYASSGAAVDTPDRISQSNTYASGLEYTDKATKQFIDELNKLNKPVTIVFYGDHLPGIFNLQSRNASPYMFETDYFIYSNQKAKQQNNPGNSHSDKIVSPNDFLPLIYKETNSKVDAYTALLTKVEKDLPAISANGSSNNRIQFTDDDHYNLTLEDLSKNQQELFKDYQLVQYDLTAGKGYLKSLDFMNQYLNNKDN